MSHNGNPATHLSESSTTSKLTLSPPSYRFPPPFSCAHTRAMIPGISYEYTMPPALNIRDPQRTIEDENTKREGRKERKKQRARNGVEST